MYKITNQLRDIKNFTLNSKLEDNKNKIEPNSKDYLENHGHIKKVFQDIGIIGISKIFSSITSIILLPVITKTLGAYGYGVWSQIFVTISLALMILRLGFDLSIPRFFIGKEIKKISEDFYSIIILILILSTLFSSILLLFPKPLANLIFDGNIIIVRILALIIIVSCLERIFLAVLQAFREMKKYAAYNIISTIVETGLAVIVILLGYNLIGAIISVLFVRLSCCIFLFFIVKKGLPYGKPNFSSLKEYLKLGLPTIPGALSHLLVDMSDRFVIGIYLGATFVGYYVPGYSIGQIIPIFISSLFAFVLLPSFSNFYINKNIFIIKTLLNLSTKYFLFISIPFMIGILILGKSILLFFTTSNIAENGYSILILTAFSGILYGLYEIYKQTFFLEKKTNLLAIYWFIGAVINLIGNIIFIPKIGILAAGITTVVSYLFVAIMVLRFSFKNIPFKLDYLSIVKIVFSSILMGLIIYLLNIYLFSNLFLLIPFGFIIYMAIIYITKGLAKEEIKFVKDLFFK